MLTYVVSPLASYKSRIILIATAVLIGLVPASAQDTKSDVPKEGTQENSDVLKMENATRGLILSEPRLIPVRTRPETYTATAYSLRGRTASGQYVTRGLIAADPRMLPLGTRVRLEAGDWSGEYVVADTGGAIRGRKIEIWTPSEGEARKFGRRSVKVSIRAIAPIFMQRELERRHVSNLVTEREYLAEAQRLYNYAQAFYSAVVDENLKNPRFLKASYNPLNFDRTAAESENLVDTYFARLRLEIDYARKLVSQTEYEKKISQIAMSEREIIKRENVSSSDVARYYETSAQIPSNIALLAAHSTKRTFWDVLSTSLPAAIVGLLGVIATFYLGHRKDKRENRQLQLERTRVEELKTRIAYLEERLGPERRLILP